MLINVLYNRGKLACAFAILLSLVFQSSYAAGSGSIKGRVLDKDTGDPLPFVNILVQNTGIGTSTDIEGKFTLRSVPEGKQTLRVSCIGYVAETREVTVVENQMLEEEFRLAAQAVPGQAVIVTAQVQGQNAAINQQLASNTISNIVAADRIKELPDVNAAESIGRLPGVAINRSNGEASTVVIRGLSAKYNTITVNGVALPATGGDDRSVDLSLISSNLLDGIEVKKANTPDMDASALGGTVDLRLREAPEELQVSASAQGGYNQLQKSYGNYNFMGSASDRFLDGDLGVIAGFNADRYNRAADKFQGDYITKPGPPITVGIQDVQLRDESVMRERAGGNLLLDYRIPYGKLSANGFYNQLASDNTFRNNQPDREHGSHYYTFQQNKSKTKIFTGVIGAKQDFDWIKYDLSVARTGTYTDDPNRRTWGFAQENSAFPNAPLDTPPFDLLSKETVDSNKTGFQSAYIYSTTTWEYQNSAQLNVQIPVPIADQVNGYIKFGGSYRWLNRANDQTQWGRDGLQYGQTSVNAPLTSALKRLAQLYPDEFNWPQDSTLCREYGQLPITRFLDRGYSRSDFLGGRWPQGMVADLRLLNMFTDALSPDTTEWKPYGIGNLGRDYSGVERYQAAYLMGEFNITQYATLLPGVRYEKHYSLYNGEVFRDNKVSNVEQAPADLNYLSVERESEFWLPMVHLSLAPTDWLKIRLARTETLTQPDYMMYAPITSMNSNNNYSRAANSLLKPAHSKNWDAAVSIYDKYVGLFSISGFYKDVYDLILQSTIYYQQPGATDDPGIPLPDGLNIPAKWLQDNSFQIDTYTNNPDVAIYRGFELEWQTHFWYLPSIFQGLILNVNYTRIFSETNKQLFFVQKTDSVIGHHRPPVYMKKLVDSSRTARMPDQPAHTANITLGWDYKGFSARVIFLYQSDRTSFIAIDQALDTFVGEYTRWDITIQQKITENFQLYANFNNLNNRHDEQYRGDFGNTSAPSYLEYYGFTMDVGIRFRL